MIVYLMRHGIAVSRTAPGVLVDNDRELTKEGIAKTRRTVAGLAKVRCSPEVIFTSPFLRARQTAEIVAATLAKHPRLVQQRLLEPEMPLENTLEWLHTIAEKEVMLVGHMPDLAQIASYMLFGADAATMIFRKSAVAKISFSRRPTPGKGVLEWLLQPRELRKFADIKGAQ